MDPKPVNAVQPNEIQGGLRVRQDQFDARKGFVLGRPKLVFILWYLVKCLFFLSPLPWPSRFKTFLLRAFGAQIGANVYFKPRLNIHFPWKLTVGDHTWVGEEVEIYNFEPVIIGSHCCISQRAFLCAGNHDFRDLAMNYRNAPITIASGVWIGACSFVGPGVTVGSEAVVTVGSVVTKNLPAGMVCGGNPCIPVKARWK
jgi:putative colanic acid biosynthesis acetyltransferase WcaF